MRLSSSKLKRIVIYGGSGSGKSSFAMELGNILHKKVIHLDDIYHLPGWKEINPDDFQEIITDTIARDSWIIDGNFSMVRHKILERATFVIILKIPSYINIWRLLWRTIGRNTRFKPYAVTRLPLQIHKSKTGEVMIPTILELSYYAVRFNLIRCKIQYKDAVDVIGKDNVAVLKSSKSVEGLLDHLYDVFIR